MSKQSGSGSGSGSGSSSNGTGMSGYCYDAGYSMTSGDY